eukprot:SAG31_NODE_2278_length_6027_cov_1.979588_3_plen_85_part_00
MMLCPAGDCPGHVYALTSVQVDPRHDFVLIAYVLHSRDISREQFVVFRTQMMQLDGIFVGEAVRTAFCRRIVSFDTNDICTCVR